jgi:hypothetical protein
LVNGKNIARSNRKEYGNSNKCSGFDREVDIFRAPLKSDDLSPIIFLTIFAMRCFQEFFKHLFLCLVAEEVPLDEQFVNLSPCHNFLLLWSSDNNPELKKGVGLDPAVSSLRQVVFARRCFTKLQAASD